MGLPQPEEMTGHTLIEFESAPMAANAG